jgi:hypothetical protein
MIGWIQTFFDRVRRHGYLVGTVDTECYAMPQGSLGSSFSFA